MYFFCLVYVLFFVIVDFRILFYIKKIGNVSKYFVLMVRYVNLYFFGESL